MSFLGCAVFLYLCHCGGSVQSDRGRYLWFHCGILRRPHRFGHGAYHGYPECDSDHGCHYVVKTPHGRFQSGAGVVYRILSHRMDRHGTPDKDAVLSFQESGICAFRTYSRGFRQTADVQTHLPQCHRYAGYRFCIGYSVHDLFRDQLLISRNHQSGHGKYYQCGYSDSGGTGFPGYGSFCGHVPLGISGAADAFFQFVWQRAERCV